MDALRYAITSESRACGDFKTRYQTDEGETKILTSAEKNRNYLVDFFSEKDKKKSGQSDSIFPSWYVD